MQKKAKIFPSSQPSVAPQKQNIYAKLAELPEEIADKITNAKTDGGRALDAIYALDGITGSQKSVLHLIGSKMTYSGNNFTGQYQFVSLTEIAKNTSICRRTVVRAINGHIDIKNPNKNYPGLIELGYLTKKCGTKYEQINLKHANLYALTPKIFNVYMEKLINEAQTRLKEIASLKFEEIEGDADSQNGDNKDMHDNNEQKSKLVTLCHQGSDTMAQGWGHCDTSLVTLVPTSSVSPSVSLSALPDAVKNLPTTSKKNKKGTYKPEKKISFKSCPTSWDEATNEQKLDILLEKAIDSHSFGVNQKVFKSYKFEYFPIELKPFYDKYNLDIIYNFYNYAIEKKAPIDVRKSEKSFLAWQNMQLQFDAPTTSSESETKREELQIVEPQKEDPVIDAIKETGFEGLSKDVFDYVRKLPKNQRNIFRKELKAIGKDAFEAMLKFKIAKNSINHSFN